MSRPVGLCLVSLIVAAILAGCGNPSENKNAFAPHPEEQAKIQSIELAALPNDPNFIGSPKVDVTCQRYLCVAKLGSTEQFNLPWPVDHWSITESEPTLRTEGSAIVGFVAADAKYACMKKFKQSQVVTDLRPCLGATEPL